MGSKSAVHSKFFLSTKQTKIRHLLTPTNYISHSYPEIYKNQEHRNEALLSLHLFS